MGETSEPAAARKSSGDRTGIPAFSMASIAGHRRTVGAALLATTLHGLSIPDTRVIARPIFVIACARLGQTL